MSDWNEELPRARNVRRGVLPQPEGVPNRLKKLERDWMIVHVHCKKAWLWMPDDYEYIYDVATGRSERRRPKHWNDPPVMTVVSRHRSEADARREMGKNAWSYSRMEAHRVFIVHREVFERLKPFWR